MRGYRNYLTNHLLPFFAKHRLSQVTIVEVDRFRNAKVREGELNARTINMHLALLAQIFEVATYHYPDLIKRNPASGRRQHLKTTGPHRSTSTRRSRSRRCSRHRRFWTVIAASTSRIRAPARARPARDRRQPGAGLPSP